MMNSKQPPSENGPEEPIESRFSEKDFIGNASFFKTIPFWGWLFLGAVLVSLIFGMKEWYSQQIEIPEEKEPFMEVTNREFSVFLWQFPTYLRVNVSKKTGYTPGFFVDKENFDSNKGEEFVSAPPDLLFLYHTWNRLLAPYFIQRPIKPSEFDEFLGQLPEWQPENWKMAPEGYVNLVHSKDYEKIENMEKLTVERLPLIVRQAFQGWKNYFKEGVMINKQLPTIGQVQLFLKQYPTYARPFWRNIDAVAGKNVAGLNYLQALMGSSGDVQEIIPSGQLSSFLKVSLFNTENIEK